MFLFANFELITLVLNVESVNGGPRRSVLGCWFHLLSSQGDPQLGMDLLVPHCHVEMSTYSDEIHVMKSMYSCEIVEDCGNWELCEIVEDCGSWDNMS